MQKGDAMENTARYYSLSTQAAGGSLDQLIQWGERGYYVTLEFTPGQGWICMVSDTGRYGEPAITTSEKPHVRAMSATCATPQEAIDSLLKVVQP